MEKLLNERTGYLIAGQCEKEKAFGAAFEGLFYSLRAAGLEVYQRIKSFQNAQGFTLKQPHDNVRYYSHSFTLVCCSVISASSSWVVDFDRHTAESHCVSSRGRLGQNMGQRRKLSGHRRPAVSFLSRGQKQTNGRAQKGPNEGKTGKFAALMLAARRES